MKRAVYLTLGVVCLLLLTAPVAHTQDNLTFDIRVGFDSFHKIETWTPVWVTIANQGPDLQAQLRFRDDYASFGASNILYTYPVELPRQSRKAFQLILPLRGQARLTIELVDQTGARLGLQETRTRGLSEETRLIGVVAGDPSLLNAVSGFTLAADDPVAVAHLTLADLPSQLQAWQGLDTLVFNDVDTSPLTPAQQAALQSWLSHGGRLIVGGGPNAAQTLAGLWPLLPFADVEMQTVVPPLPTLDDFMRVSPEERGPYAAAVPLDVTGRILVEADEQPLIISVDHGLGHVFYLAFDLSLAPFDVLTNQPQFFRRFMNRPAQNSYFADQANPGRLRDSLSIIPGQTLPTPATVALYLFIYVLAMGPANYAILARLKRREWAWFSIPLIILIFSAYGYFSGFRLRSGRPLLRQITVIQAETGASLADIDSFIGIFSPFRADYTLTLDRPVLVEPLADNYGVNNELTVTTAAMTIVENLRSDIGGVPAVVAHSQMTPPAISADLRFEAGDNRGERRLQGHITNGTGQPLRFAHLVLDGEVLLLDTLAVGKTPVEGRFAPCVDYSCVYPEPDGNSMTPEILDLATRGVAQEAILGADNDSPAASGRLYLVGWLEDSPIQAELANRQVDQLRDTLLLVGLPLVAQ